MAEEKGIDLSRVSGTGPEGRITREDVESFLQGAAGRAGEAAGSAARGRAPAMSKMRQAIARRMSQSKREAPHYYVTVVVEMTEAQRLRSQLNATLGEEAHVSVNDLLVKASAKALQRYPDVQHLVRRRRGAASRRRRTSASPSRSTKG